MVVHLLHVVVTVDQKVVFRGVQSCYRSWFVTFQPSGSQMQQLQHHPQHIRIVASLTTVATFSSSGAVQAASGRVEELTQRGALVRVHRQHLWVGAAPPAKDSQLAWTSAPWRCCWCCSVNIVGGGNVRETVGANSAGKKCNVGRHECGWGIPDQHFACDHIPRRKRSSSSALDLLDVDRKRAHKKGFSEKSYDDENLLRFGFQGGGKNNK